MPVFVSIISFATSGDEKSIMARLQTTTKEIYTHNITK